MRLIYVLLGIFLWIHIGGLSGIADAIARDVDYFIECYHVFTEYFFIDAVG